MQTAVVDIGNSFTKIYRFEDSIIEKTFNEDKSKKLVLSEFIDKDTPCIISAVGNLDNRIDTEGMKNIILFSHDSKLPISVNYETPHTLGLDRIANAVAVSGDNSNHLVIDIGTCVTFDFLDRYDVYQGGLIYPGINMRFKAMHNQTDKLPLIEDWKKTWSNNSILGKNTETSMINGIKQGMIMELNELIHQYSESYPGLVVHLTGGDSVFFEKELKSSIFAQPFIGAMGLQKILAYNL